MSAVLTPPQPPTTAAPAAGPQPWLWTVAEFNDLGDRGLFEGRRAYLIDGVIWEQGPMNEPHAVALALVLRVLMVAFGPTWHLRGQSPLNVGERTNPQPDYAVVPGDPRDYLAAQPGTAGLVVEISDSTLAEDTTTKAEKYATAGVEDYWVLDLEGRRLIVFRDPAPLPVGLGATAYRRRMEYGPADTVSPLAAPAATIRVADLLP